MRPIRRLAAEVAAVGAGGNGGRDMALGMVSAWGYGNSRRCWRAFTDLGRRLAERTTELRNLNGRLAALRPHDGLTGLANRRTFDVQFSEDWWACREAGRPLAVVMLDVDHFKLFSTTPAAIWPATRRLRAVARMLRAAVAGTRYLAALWRRGIRGAAAGCGSRHRAGPSARMCAS